MNNPRINTPGRNVISWFEIPIRRLDESLPFYENVFKFNGQGGFDIVKSTSTTGRKCGVFQYTPPNQGSIEYYGALVEYSENEELPTCSESTFSAESKVDYCGLLNNVVNNGGSIISQDQHDIVGIIAKCKDNLQNEFTIKTLVSIIPCPQQHPHP